MSIRPLFKGLLIFSLIVGVSLKILVATRAEVDPMPPMLGAASSFLERQGFHIRGATQNLDLAIIRASRPGCHLVLLIMAPQGWHGGIAQQWAQAGQTLFYVFNGQIGDRQPVWHARLQLYANLLLRQVGFAPVMHPLLGVVSDADCHASALPWNELAVVQLR